jgi:hypothetical protein
MGQALQEMPGAAAAAAAAVAVTVAVAAACLDSRVCQVLKED